MASCCYRLLYHSSRSPIHRPNVVMGRDRRGAATTTLRDSIACVVGPDRRTNQRTQTTQKAAGGPWKQPTEAELGDRPRAIGWTRLSPPTRGPGITPRSTSDLAQAGVGIRQLPNRQAGHRGARAVRREAWNQAGRGGGLGPRPAAHARTLGTVEEPQET